MLLGDARNHSHFHCGEPVHLTSLAQLKYIFTYLPSKSTPRSRSQTDKPSLSKGQCTIKSNALWAYCYFLGWPQATLFHRVRTLIFYSEASPLALTANGAKASCRDMLPPRKGPTSASRWSLSNARCSLHHKHHLVQVTGETPLLHSGTKFTVSFPGIQHNTGRVKFLYYPQFKITQSS